MEYDFAIIGLGPAGQKAALCALNSGASVVAFEKNCIGGTCLNLGCIPTKSILHSCEVISQLKNAQKLGVCQCDTSSFSWINILKRKDEIVSKFNSAIEKDLIKRGLELVKAQVCLVSEQNKTLISDGKTTYAAKNIIIASGSEPLELEALKFDKEFILSSDDLYDLNDTPGSIAIVGSGAIGIEWARIFNILGTEVTVIEKAPNLLPAMDIDISKRFERIFKQKKIKFHTNCAVDNMCGHSLCLTNGLTLKPDKVLVAAGRKRIIPFCNEKIFLTKGFATNLQNVYVVGDASFGPMLAHNASYQAKKLIYELLNNNPHCNCSLIPSVVYGSPEAASVGLREQDIDDKINTKIASIPVAFLPKSWCDEAIEGFIKIISKNDKILGAHIVSKEASSMIMQVSIAMSAGLTVSSLKNLIFPHPTYCEGICEAIDAI